MAYRGAVFDLFGTLVPPFPAREHEAAAAEAAAMLGVPAATLSGVIHAKYLDRITGGYREVGDYVTEAAPGATPDQVAAAVARMTEFLRAALVPVPGAIETLTALRAAGLRLALVTNCGPDAPGLWTQTPMAEFFEVTAFSCELGTAKPAPAIYQHAIDGLDLPPAELLYVGDGSDHELTGAAALGLTPVLVTVDLSNTFDTERADVATWTGLRVDGLPGVVPIATASQGVLDLAVS
ncbi:HAD family hydrolase [Longispora albida]|uniref:HAD family hydrolase n=1 Tax=Longispora albida TaxID=203523 RepID=UPI00035CE80A|nr:HAD-IA family hydrolase [Longispora albida]